MKIEQKINQIIDVLNDVSEHEWNELFLRYLSKLKNPNINRDIIVKDLLKIFGGMGSFNDLVLYKDGQLCFDQNVKLNLLRKDLFNILIQIRSSNNNEEREKT